MEGPENVRTDSELASLTDVGCFFIPFLGAVDILFIMYLFLLSFTFTPKQLTQDFLVLQFILNVVKTGNHIAFFLLLY